MKTLYLSLQSLVPVFIAWVGGLYIYQAMNTPKRIFTRRECWVIGLSAELLAAVLSLNNRFHWFV